MEQRAETNLSSKCPKLLRKKAGPALGTSECKHAVRAEQVLLAGLMPHAPSSTARYRNTGNTAPGWYTAIPAQVSQEAITYI